MFLFAPFRALSIFVLVWCLFSFKIDILGEIRIDDILILSFFFCCLLYLTYFNVSLRFLSQPSIVFFFIFIGLSLLSTLYNHSIGRIDGVQGVLYTLRHFEYFVFFLLGYFLAKYDFVYDKVIIAYLFFVLFLIPLQYLGWFPVFSGFSPDRAIANTGGPWELAVVSAFMVFYFKNKNLFLLAFVSFVVLVLTESRVTLFAAVILILYELCNYAKRRGVFMLSVTSFICLFAISLGVLAEFDIQLSVVGVVDRVLLAFSPETFSVVAGFFQSSNVVVNSSEYLELEIFDKLNFSLEDAGGDQSAFVRFSNWALLLRSSFQSVDSIIFGLGPSFAGKAVDGAYVRLLVEVGIAGLLSYVLFMVSLLKFVKCYLLNRYTWIVIVSAFFIDVFTTYKIMMLLWLFYGDLLGRVKR